MVYLTAAHAFDLTIVYYTSVRLNGIWDVVTGLSRLTGKEYTSKVGQV